MDSFADEQAVVHGGFHGLGIPSRGVIIMEVRGLSGCRIRSKSRYGEAKTENHSQTKGYDSFIFHAYLLILSL